MKRQPAESLSKFLDCRPIVIAIAGPNGAGKSTFYQAHLRSAGLPFVNADVIATVLELDAYSAAGFADRTRRDLLKNGVSFIFETVFSDAAGDKLRFLEEAEHMGYTVVLLFIGIATPDIADTRVAMRVAKGGHDVPKEKLYQRYPRTLENLRAALPAVEHVYVLDNSNLREPYRLIVRCESGKLAALQKPIPVWLESVLTSEGELRS